MYKLSIATLLLLTTMVFAEPPRLDGLTDTATPIRPGRITLHEDSSVDLYWTFINANRTSGTNDLTGANRVYFNYSPAAGGWTQVVTGSVDSAANGRVLLQFTPFNTATNGVFEWNIEVSSNGVDIVKHPYGSLNLRRKPGGGSTNVFPSTSNVTDLAGITFLNYPWLQVASASVVASNGWDFNIGSGAAQIEYSTNLNDYTPSATYDFNNQSITNLATNSIFMGPYRISAGGGSLRVNNSNLAFSALVGSASSVLAGDIANSNHVIAATNTLGVQIAGNDTDIASLLTSNAAQDVAIVALVVSNNAQHVQITGNDTDIASLIVSNNAQDVSVAALVVSNNAQDVQIAGNDTDIASLLVSNAAQDVSIVAITAVTSSWWKADGSVTGVAGAVHNFSGGRISNVAHAITTTEYLPLGQIDTKADLETVLTDVANILEDDVAETLTANWVNTANPWADNEVVNALTVDDAGIAATITRDSELVSSTNALDVALRALTNTAGSVNNSGNTFIQDAILDANGNITNWVSAAASETLYAAVSNALMSRFRAETNAVPHDSTTTYTMTTGESYSDSLVMYMRFDVPLNPAGVAGNWTDYEIKIFAVTNWTQEWTNSAMVYWYDSESKTNVNLGYGDTNANAYFTDDYDPHPLEDRGRVKWNLHTNLISIASQLVNANSVVENVLHYPSHLGCQVPWTNWMWYANSHNLRASFMRKDATGSDTNTLGDVKWHPLSDDWIPKRKNEAPRSQSE
jgi:hypothetical protein